MIIDPILFLLMTNIERSQILGWRLSWLPGGIPRPCIYHSLENFTRKHAIECLHMHSRLQMPLSIEDPLSYLRKHLPVKKPRIHEMDHLFHEQVPPPTPQDPGASMVNWLLV
ncbi:hypothetical protein BD408DRAFT_412836 [Parasitella parasitica]|nr:hypothetical protein BD408DRAFT_412836 [Parasitella parasitica]